MCEDSSRYEGRFLDASIALDIFRLQRDGYRDQIVRLEAQLAAAVSRADRAETRLHEAVMRLSRLDLQTGALPVRSTATEVLADGKRILRLDNPVFVPRKVMRRVGA
jgi:hypothetical protein